MYLLKYSMKYSSLAETYYVMTVNFKGIFSEFSKALSFSSTGENPGSCVTDIGKW